jgi:hypothetical protein
VEGASILVTNEPRRNGDKYAGCIQRGINRLFIGGAEVKVHGVPKRKGRPCWPMMVGVNRRGR